MADLDGSETQQDGRCNALLPNGRFCENPEPTLKCAAGHEGPGARAVEGVVEVDRASFVDELPSLPSTLEDGTAFTDHLLGEARRVRRQFGAASLTQRLEEELAAVLPALGLTLVEPGLYRWHGWKCGDWPTSGRLDTRGVQVGVESEEICVWRFEGWSCSGVARLGQGIDASALAYIRAAVAETAVRPAAEIPLVG